MPVFLCLLKSWVHVSMPKWSLTWFFSEDVQEENMDIKDEYISEGDESDVYSLEHDETAPQGEEIPDHQGGGEIFLSKNGEIA